MSDDKKKIIYPSSLEIYDYLNDGKGICNQCGAIMDEEIQNGFGVYICPGCGWTIDVMEYEYEDGDDMEFAQDDRGDEYLVFKEDTPPAGCRDCGGPYPYCKSTCKRYDD